MNREPEPMDAKTAEGEERYLADAWAFVLALAEKSDDGDGQDVPREGQGEEETRRSA